MIQKSVPTPSSYMFYNFTLKPSFVVYYVNSTSFEGYALQFRQIFTPDAANPYSGRMSINSLQCLGAFQTLLQSLLPSPNAQMLLLDDLGMMVASTVANTIAANSTVRYALSNNPDAATAAVGAYLTAQYGGTSSSSSALSIGSNFTMSSSVSILGAPTIVATQLVAMPGTAQTFVLVMFAPRADFYGAAAPPFPFPLPCPPRRARALHRQSEAAFRQALITSLSIAAAGIVLVAAMAYFASLPLKRLVNSMNKVTALHYLRSTSAQNIPHQLKQFDFTVLENGSLESNSVISELYAVETAFLSMVKAFAHHIKVNRELSHSSARFSVPAKASVKNLGGGQ
ncbi:hypothetical protein HDU82_001036 [Entophlyctis luteolus]|nr:hypothetical protein HDU82_001036 [Entophlyctis luteolus]